MDKAPWERFYDKMEKLSEAEWEMTDETDKAALTLLDNPLVTLEVEEGHAPPSHDIQFYPPMEDIELDAKPPKPVYSLSYIQLDMAGWEYDGCHGRGGGMGYHMCDEFKHPKYGRLSFGADISHMASREEKKKYEEAAPFRDYSSWFLMLDGDDNDWDFTGKVTRVDSGNTLNELEEVLKVVDAGY